MRNSIWLAAACGLLVLPVCSSMKTKVQSISPSKTNLTASKFKWSVTRKAQTEYLVYAPQDYDARSDKQWPLLMFLHGAGERGTDVQNAAVHGPLHVVKDGTNLPFIIVAPLCPPGQTW